MNEKTQTLPRRRIRWLMAAGVLLAAVALPAVVITQASANGEGLLGGLASRIAGTASHYLHLGGDDMRITSGGPEGTLKIHVHGKLQFSEAEDDVQSLTGSLSVDDRRGGRNRQLVIEAGEGGGSAKRVYKRDGAVLAQMDAEDRQWLAGIVSELIDARTSPAERVERLMQRGGLAAVFTHIETRARDDFRRRSLIEALLARGPLDGAALDRTLALADQIRSDFDRSTALRAVLARQTLSEAQLQQLLRSTAAIGSDFDAREVLVSLAPKLGNSEAVLQGWVEAVKAIGSDFDARAALESLMATPPSPDAARNAARVGAALQASLTLDSDFDHRSALQAIARRLDASHHAAQIQAYADSAARIGSGFERREALVSLLEVKGLGKAGVMSVLNASENMGGFETLQVLQAAAAVMPADAELIARYRKLARGLGDHERGQAEKALDRLAAS